MKKYQKAKKNTCFIVIAWYNVKEFYI